MKNKLLRIFSMAVIVCMVTTFMPLSMVSAEDQAGSDAVGDQITIRVDGTTYENIKVGDEFLVKDLSKMNIEFLSVNGHQLVNVGTKSGVKDSQGRNVLEVGINKTSSKLWVLRLCYHAIDDPVESNHGHGFDIMGLKFKTSADAAIEVPTVSKVASIKLTPKSKALKVTWKKSSGVTAYQIQYATTKSKLNSAKKIKVLKSKTSYTIKKLKAKKKYYVRVRAYTEYTDIVGEKLTVYGTWVTLSKTTK